jgi:NADP-dependent 3-hydroxy acid dehydrogenase YdfG
MTDMELARAHGHSGVTGGREESLHRLGTILGTRIYAPADQERFAQLSGDFNPLHLEPVQARRELAGDVVVHGVHLVLDALDRYVATLVARGLSWIALTDVSARFNESTYLHHTVDVCLIEEAERGAMLQITALGRPVLDLTVEWAVADSQSGDTLVPEPSDWSADERVAVSLAFDQLDGRSGALPLNLNRSLASTMFPHLARILPASSLAGLLAISRLVGMECPGLRSILSAFDVTWSFSPSAATEPTLNFRVVRSDARFSLINLNISGGKMSGTVTAFLRPGSKAQASMKTVERVVLPLEFSTQRALIIGGTRGLGEVTAKIIAAGGGYPIITYRDGISEAQRIVEEIGATGRCCCALACDVLEPERFRACLAETGVVPSHLYFFATPKIFVKKSDVYDKQVFRRFADVYLDGFFTAYRACRTLNADRLTIFYPSSTALDECVPELAEYAAAKAAGEALCTYLVASDPSLTLVVKRLPRIATDQTATLFHQTAADALKAMLEVVRSLAASSVKLE